MVRGYTTIEQSRKLAEILPLKSADMYYFRQIDNDYLPPNVESICPIPLFKDGKEDFKYDVPCWSLAALLGVLPKSFTYEYHVYELMYNTSVICYMNVDTYNYDMIYSTSEVLVDACYELILKLNELNLL